MPLPSYRRVEFIDDVFPEPTPGDNRLVLWLRGHRTGRVQHWERICTVPEEPIATENGLCATPATSLSAIQRIRGFFGQLLRRFQTESGDRSWLLPTGDTAEQVGKQQTDLLLVWADNDNLSVDETRLKAHWPQSNRCVKLGNNLYLLSGVPPGQTSIATSSTLPQATPAEQAEHFVAAARSTGDRCQEALALTDLGIVYLNNGDASRAVTALEEALALSRQIGDRSRECDVLSNLGMVALAMRQAGRALELLTQALVLARATGNRFEEKTTLTNLGMAYASQGDHAQALTLYEAALALTRALGDGPTEADLLWYQAIEHADLGHRDQADVCAQAAIDLLEHLGKPQVTVLADHLRRYRQGESGFSFGDHAANGLSALPRGSSDRLVLERAGQAPSGPIAVTEPETTGSQMLRIAWSAAKALTKFLCTGAKRVAAETRQRRLQTCATCEHHTGMRCQVCGCFTSVKASLPHEDCPLGKWPK